jgi:hypothetical protein
MNLMLLPLMELTLKLPMELKLPPHVRPNKKNSTLLKKISYKRMKTSTHTTTDSKQLMQRRRRLKKTPDNKNLLKRETKSSLLLRKMSRKLLMSLKKSIEELPNLEHKSATLRAISNSVRPHSRTTKEK